MPLQYQSTDWGLTVSSDLVDRDNPKLPAVTAVVPLNSGIKFIIPRNAKQSATA